MYHSAVLLFPHQLFKNITPIISNDSEKYIYYLIEEPLFFSDKERIESFNGLKLIMHRASMKIYEDYLLDNGLNVKYIEYKKIKDLHSAISEANHIIYYELTDHLLQKRLDKMVHKYKKTYTVLPSQNFICKLEELDEFIQGRSKYKRKYFQTDFYRWQRKRLNILMDEDGDFIGGKLSYDSENRHGVPKGGFPELKYHTTKKTKFIEEAQTYVRNTFPNYLGNVDNYEHISFSFNDARAKLRIFLENRLIQFGNYEDAIYKENPFLYHSLMSSALNIGIITPNEVVEEALDYFYKNQKTIKINEIEGFIRQIIGWREYYRMVYMHLYDNLVNQNLLDHSQKLSNAWYSGETGIEPVDFYIKTAFDYGYLHHIIRLMVVGQFMLLCEIHPDEMYRWFMEFAIDSYDWVMVPNIYGMVGYNDGGGTTTKPYISSSNYILKMSNFKSKKGSNSWNYIWKALYYRFIHKHIDILKHNPRTSRMVWHMNNMKEDELDELLKTGNEFIENV